MNKVDITPHVGMFMGGYGMDDPRVSTGTHEPLFARCLVLWEDNAPHVVVTADVLAIGRAMHQDIRRRVTAMGVRSTDFMMTATHTHNGPVLNEVLDPCISYALTARQLGVVDDYTKMLIESIVDLVRSTLRLSATTCALDYSVTRAAFSQNREAIPHKETAVPVLVGRSQAGDPLFVLFSYGCHPVAGGEQTLFDPDFPGLAIGEIEAATGAFAQFILGPAGDRRIQWVGPAAGS